VYGNCNVFTELWKNLTIDGAEKTKVIIPNLDADEEYCVKMKSVSFIGDSHFTEPLKHSVLRTGNSLESLFYIIRCYLK